MLARLWLCSTLKLLADQLIFVQHTDFLRNSGSPHTLWPSNSSFTAAWNEFTSAHPAKLKKKGSVEFWRPALMQMSLSRTLSCTVKVLFFLVLWKHTVRYHMIPVWPPSEGAFRQIVCVSWRRREFLSVDILAVIYLEHQLVWCLGPFESISVIK